MAHSNSNNNAGHNTNNVKQIQNSVQVKNTETPAFETSNAEYNCNNPSIKAHKMIFQ